MIRALAGAALITLSFNAMSAKTTTATPRPITASDLVRLDRVSDPRLSPDGAHVAFAVRRTDYEANKGVTAVWLMKADGTGAHAATTAEGSHYDPRWSADGRYLYFLSTRSGSPQVWRLDRQRSGEATQVTDLPLDVGSYALAADGKHLAVALEVFADCADLACTKRRLEERADDKRSGMLFDKLFVRHWDTWKNGMRSQLFTLTIGVDGQARCPVQVSKGIDGDVPTKPFGDSGEYGFAPDGATIAFTARIAGSSEPWSTNLDVWLAPTDGSAPPRNLTQDNEAMDTSPVFSPDGGSLAYLSMRRPGFEADRLAVKLYDLKTDRVREVAPDWDRSAGPLQFSADGKTLYTTADDLGQHRLFAIDVASGKVEGVSGAGHVGGFDVGADGIIYAYDSLTAPADLYHTDLAGTGHQRLTQFNVERLQHVQFGDYEQFAFAGWNDETVYGYVMKPWNYRKGKKYPVAFIVHGGPQGSMGNDWHYRWNPAIYSGMGYAVVFIDFHGSTGYGQAFTDSITGDWGGKPLVDLQKGWAYALDRYDFLDGERAGALGASYGGFMMNWIAGNWSDAFTCIVNHDGIFDNRSMYYTTEELWFEEWEHGGPQYLVPENYEASNPANFVKNWQTPMLVIHGEKDYRVPPEQGIATFTALQRRGIPSQLLIYPDENHWVLKPQNSVQWHETVEAWLDRWLKQ